MVGERVLLVDNKTADLLRCQAVLAGQGYAVRTTDRGSTALAFLGAETVDILALDIVLPDLEGLAVLQQGLELDPSLIVLVMADLAAIGSAISALAAGAHGLIVRPFTPVELLAEIERVQARHQEEQARLRRWAAAQVRRCGDELHDRVRQADRLRMLAELDQALGATLNPTRVAKIAVQRIAAAVAAPRATLLLPSLSGEIQDVHVLTMENEWAETAPAPQDLPGLQTLLQRLQASQKVGRISQGDLLALGDPCGLALHGGAASLLVPLWGEVKGVALAILGGWPEGHILTDSDGELAQIFISRASQALCNAQFYQDSQERASRLAMLNKISNAVVSSLEPRTVLRLILELTCQALDATEASILLHEPGAGLVFALSLAGDERALPGRQLAVGQGIAGWVFQHGQTICVDDVQADTRFYAGVDAATGFETRSLLCAPLKHHGRAIGVIEVVNKRAGKFSHEDVNMLEAVSPIAATALENARLYNELRTLLRERERAQAQLIHTEKMAALGRLVASIAHEINNPLAAVQVRLGLAQEELHGREGLDEIVHHLEIAEDEIERTSGIVRRMRDFYRPAREELRPTDLHGVLESVLELVGKQLQHSKIVVVREWAAGLAPIQTNPDHLKQVFLNLTLNAIDAMPAGGTLFVRTAPGQMVPNGPRPRAAVRIEFRDTGVGMPPEVLSRIFEPFFTAKEQGTGLGLSISYGIIRSLQGEITVTSQEASGSTFTILLPYQEADPAQAKADSAFRLSGKSG